MLSIVYRAVILVTMNEDSDGLDVIDEIEREICRLFDEWASAWIAFPFKTRIGRWFVEKILL